MAASTSRPTAREHQEPAAPARHPGAGVLAVRHPVRAALLPPGGQRRRATTPRPPSQSVRDDRRAAPARPDRRRPWAARWSPTAARGSSRSTARCSASCRAGSGTVLLQRLAGRRRTCARPGSEAPGDLRRRRQRDAAPAGTGSPYQPVPVAADVAAAGRAADPRAARGLPRRCWREQQSVRAYPAPYGVNARARARLPQPDHRGRVDAGRGGRRHARSTAPRSVGRAGVEKEYDAWLRGMPGYKQVAVDSMGRVLGDAGEVAGAARRHPGHLHRREGPGRRREAARARRSRPPAQTYDEVTAQQLRGRLAAPPS